MKKKLVIYICVCMLLFVVTHIHTFGLDEEPLEEQEEDREENSDDSNDEEEGSSDDSNSVSDGSEELNNKEQGSNETESDEKEEDQGEDSSNNSLGGDDSEEQEANNGEDKTPSPLDKLSPDQREELERYKERIEQQEEQLQSEFNKKPQANQGPSDSFNQMGQFLEQLTGRKVFSDSVGQESEVKDW